MCYTLKYKAIISQNNQQIQFLFIKIKFNQPSSPRRVQRDKKELN